MWKGVAGGGARRYKLGTDGTYNFSIGDHGADTNTTYTPHLRVLGETNGRSAGNVGIGTTTPTATLGVKGSITFETAQDNVLKGIYWRSGTDGSWGQLVRDHTTGAMYIDSQVGAPLNLNYYSAGNVGTGKTSPSTELDVNGTVTARARDRGILQRRRPGGERHSDNHLTELLRGSHPSLMAGPFSSLPDSCPSASLSARSPHPLFQTADSR